MNALTPMQASMLDAIRDSVNTRGYPPSVGEIGRQVGLASEAKVIRQLQILHFKGCIQLIPGTRAVRILDPREASHA